MTRMMSVVEMMMIIEIALFRVEVLSLVIPILILELLEKAYNHLVS